MSSRLSKVASLQKNPPRWLGLGCAFLLLLGCTVGLCPASASTLATTSIDAPTSGGNIPRDSKNGLAPGLYPSLPCGSGSAWTYSAFVPAAYAQSREAWPVLFLSNPEGHPASEPHDLVGNWKPWAETHGVLIIGINDSENGIRMDEIARMQDAVIAAAEGQLRLHPWLRFSAGPSGGAMCGAFLAQRRGLHWGGVLMTIHGGNGVKPAIHVPMAFLAGEKDELYPFPSLRRDYLNFRAIGNPVRIESYPELGHGGIPQADQGRMMEWLLDFARLTHPLMDEGARRAAHHEIQARLLRASQIKERAQKLEEHERLVLMPKLGSFQGTEPVLVYWFSARRDRIAEEKDPRKRYFLLCDLESHPAARLLGTVDRRILSEQLSECRNRSPIREDLLAERDFSRLPQLNRITGVEQAVLALAAYRDFAKGHPGTEEAARAVQIAENISAALDKAKARGP
ncbi:MAG: hypothetical protein HQL31_02565 [Planctomycetes bacterium]|nr:hypothetical protein [Planctomycetota bacterium]